MDAESIAFPAHIDGLLLWASVLPWLHKQGLDHFQYQLIPVYQDIILFCFSGLAFGIILFFLSPGIIKNFFAF
jgi:hypothetical protein